MSDPFNITKSLLLYQNFEKRSHQQLDLLVASERLESATKAVDAAKAKLLSLEESKSAIGKAVADKLKTFLRVDKKAYIYSKDDLWEEFESEARGIVKKLVDQERKAIVKENQAFLS